MCIQRIVFPFLRLMWQNSSGRYCQLKGEVYVFWLDVFSDLKIRLLVILVYLAWELFFLFRTAVDATSPVGIWREGDGISLCVCLFSQFWRTPFIEAAGTHLLAIAV